VLPGVNVVEPDVRRRDVMHGRLELSLDEAHACPDDLLPLFADLSVWLEAHPCDCEALCECEST